MTDDEYTVLMIAAEGESMIPIGRWEEPIRTLTLAGLMRKLDQVNYVITQAGRCAMVDEESQRDGALKKVLTSRRQEFDRLHVDMTVVNRRIEFDLTYDMNFMADVNTAKTLQHNGACEPEVVHLMRRVLREGDFAIDGGANIGFMTLVMSRLVGAQGHVEAFEPATVNFKKLRANIELNRVENVTAVQRALWGEDTAVTLHQGLDSGECSLMPVDNELVSTPCQALTLDRWCGAYDQAPRLLKLDIEGAELNALMGAQALLTCGIDFISCELNEESLLKFGTSQADLRDFMASKGYSTFVMSEAGERPSLVDRSMRVNAPRPSYHVLFSTEQKVHAAWAESI